MGKKKSIKPCEITCSKRHYLGYLYIQNNRVIILLNNISSSIDLGPLKTIKRLHIEPEAIIDIIPTPEVDSIKIYKYKT